MRRNFFSTLLESRPQQRIPDLGGTGELVVNPETLPATAGRFGGHSMVARLRRVALCSPQVCGWSDPARVSQWQALSYQRQPDASRAQEQHDRLRRVLESFGAEVLLLDADDSSSLDAVYVHDPSFLTDHGAICLRMGKPCRAAEPPRHRAFYESIGVPVMGEIEEPGTAEAGDIVWLDPATLLVGHGHRTNAAGIDQLRALLKPKGIQVLVAPLPHGAGPESCLHLMSLLSLLDARTALVDLAWLSVPTVELLRERGFALIEIDPSERDTLACNVLALGDGALLAFEENPRTNNRLRQAGFELMTVSGSEIGINGGGGPTCLTRPLWRAG
jgi:N-dimethylarginine dimethylaminohydrolase